MKLERITDMEHEWYQKATALYQISFPVHEQREKASQEKILGWNDYHFYLILEENTFVGLLLGWETERFLYIEHFCIQPELRGRRYGQWVLEALREAGRQVILEIDPPVDDVSIRRKQFYTRCGFVENPYHHVHPPYHRGNQGHELVVLSSPAAISGEEYQRFRDYLERRVMADVYD